MLRYIRWSDYHPSLMAKERIKGEEALSNHYQTICDIVDGDMSAEVLSSDFDILEEGKKWLAKMLIKIFEDYNADVKKLTGIDYSESTWTKYDILNGWNLVGGKLHK